MNNAFVERLIAQSPKKSERGNIDWLAVLALAAQDPQTVEFLREIPSAERRKMLAETGSAVFRQDLGNIASELAYNTEPVVQTGQIPGLRDMLVEHVAMLFASLSDELDMANRADAEAHLAATEIFVHGREKLAPFLGQRGIVLLSVYQSHFGYALPVLGDLGKIALIRKPLGTEGPDYMPPKLLEWRDSVELVPADASGGIRLFQLLRKGGSVGLYNDFLYGDARAAKSLLFGGTVPISRTLLRLVRSTSAVVIPMAVARRLPPEGSKVDVHLFSPLAASLEKPCNEAALGIQIAVVTELLIRRFPVQWRLWNTLRLRWQAGRELP